MTDYYFCRQNLFKSHGAIEIIGHTQDTGKFLWTAGHKFNEVLLKQTLFLDSAYGENFPEFFDTTVPVMSDNLINTFYDLGVDNFDIYDVLLKRKDTSEEFGGYKMVNFVGCVDAFDREKSKFDEDAYKHRGPVFIDDGKVKGLKVFRLSEPTSLLVVSEEIASKLIEKNYFALLLQKTTDYDGF